MSGGYVALAIIFFVLALGVTLLVYHFFTKVSIKTFPIHCAVWHLIALYMCIVPFPLLVVDVDAALSVRGNPDGPQQRWMRPIWISIFAVTYFSAWVSLPIAQMYTEVGPFKWQGAVLASIKLNLRLYLVIIVLGVIAFGYLLILKGAYISFASVAKLGISLANAWGLLILTLFMPAGLVGVPRNLWRYADAKRMLRRHLYDAMEIQEDLDLSAMDLASIKGELIAIDPSVSEENRPHLAHMLELISKADREIPLYHLASQRIKTSALNAARPDSDVSLAHLEDLHVRLKRSIKVVGRANYRWMTTVRQCDALDQIIRGVKGSNNPFKRVWFPIRKYVYWIGCGITSILTVLILWSELVLPFSSLSPVPLGVIEFVMNSPVHFPASVVLLFYMAYCAYWAAFQFKVFDVYAVYPTIADNASFCFNVTFLVRLLMPLCFNFLLISGFTDATKVDVQYGHVYRQNMDVSTLLGERFNRFLPMLIPFVAAIVFLNLTSRVLTLVGVEIHSPNDIESPAVRQRLEDGRKLVEMELGYHLASVLLPGEENVDGVRSPTSSNVGPGRLGGRDAAAAAGSTTPGASEVRGQRYREFLEKKKAAQGDGQEMDAEV